MAKSKQSKSPIRGNTKNGTPATGLPSPQQKGKNVTKNANDRTTSSSSAPPLSSSLFMIAIRFIVVICSLSIGLLTPFIWDMYQEQKQLFNGGIFEKHNGIKNYGTNRHKSSSKSGNSLKTDETCENEDAVGSSIWSYQTKYICDKETLSNYLHDEAVPGLHVACIQPTIDGSGGGWKLTLYQYAVDQHKNTPIVVTIDGNQNNKWYWLKQQLISNLGLRSADDLHQPWAIFSPDGNQRLRDEESNDQESITDLAGLGMFLLFEGGQWIWPGVRKGYRRTIDLSLDRNATLETLSLYPLVLSVDGFLSEEECDYIQQAASPTMKYSEVTLMDHDKGRPSSDFRTSQSTFLPATGDATLTSIDDRTARLVRIPKNHQEHAQVLRYGHSEKYDAHHDYFNPKLYQNDRGTMRLIGNGKWNRMATVFWYLSDVAEGGETNFPRHDRAPQPRDLKRCDSGLKVKPVRGRVIIFYSLTSDGELDPYSLHGACPVVDGIKHAANKWVWNSPQQFVL